MVRAAARLLDNLPGPAGAANGLWTFAWDGSVRWFEEALEIWAPTRATRPSASTSYRANATSASGSPGRCWRTRKALRRCSRPRCPHAGISRRRTSRSICSSRRTCGPRVHTRATPRSSRSGRAASCIAILPGSIPIRCRSAPGSASGSAYSTSGSTSRSMESRSGGLSRRGRWARWINRAFAYTANRLRTRGEPESDFFVGHGLGRRSPLNLD